MPIYNRQGEGVINELSIDSSDVLLDPYTNNPIYQFDSKYLFNSESKYFFITSIFSETDDGVV